MGIGVALLAAGVVLGLYGLLLLSYDDTAATSITLRGNRVDASDQLGVVLPIALAVIAFALWLLLRRRRDPS